MAEDYEFKQKYGFGVIQRFTQDKGSYQLQQGIDLISLGFDYKNNTSLHQSFISPFIDDNNTQPDPLLKPCASLQSKNPPNINKKKEFFANFSEETLFYIFYNMIDEQQQLWAVEQLYQKGWRYNFKKEQWFSDMIQQGQNQFLCKYFSIQNWKIVESSQIELQEDEFCTIEDFYVMQFQQ